VKRLIGLAALAAVFLGSTLSVSTPAFANQTVAQSSSMSGSMSGEAGMKAAMDKLHDQMSSMTMSGNPDKDYMAVMKMLLSAMKNVNHAEMTGGKDPSMTKHAKDLEKAFAAPSYGSFGV
jgi:hypothetical protein